MALARLWNSTGRSTEIVSCDSMQVYRRMDIGTAKPGADERREVAHHMIDVAEPTEDHDLPRFLEAARRALEGIRARGANALLVGGTGLYVRGLVDGFDPPPHFPEVAAELESVADTDELARRLAELDPRALERIPPGNRRRIVRALEVTIGSGTPFSEHGSSFDDFPATDVELYALGPSRASMTTSIRERVDAQMEAGFLDEVASLLEVPGGLSRNSSQALGYRDLIAHLEGRRTLEEAVEDTKVRTRRFAVRQVRWFSRDPRIRWVAPPGDGGRSVDSVAAGIAGGFRK